MTPVSPALPSHPELPEIVFAKDQPQYQPLPAYRDPNGVVVSRWRLTWRERLRIFLRGNLWLQLHTFNQPLTPSMLTVSEPEVQ